MQSSYLSPSRDLAVFRKALDETGTPRAALCALEELAGWEFTSSGFRHHGAKSSTQIVSVDVTAPRREVSHWQQPLVADAFADSVVLLSAVIDGEFRVALSIADELGFQGNAKFGPSWQRALTLHVARSHCNTPATHDTRPVHTIGGHVR